MKKRKISDTSIRVMKTLKVLTETEASISDILHHFEKIDPTNRIYTSEVILKYINTLKVFGLRFDKKKDKYVLLNSPCQIDLNDRELSALYLIEQYSKNFPEPKIREEIVKFLEKIEKIFSDNTKILAHEITKPSFVKLELNFDKHQNRIIQYEKYCQDGLRLKITYTNPDNLQNTIMADPQEIKYSGNEIFLSVYNPLLAQMQDINFKTIIDITQLPSKTNPTNMLSSVTFKLKDPLSKKYKLHYGEQLINSEQNGDVIISNKIEDRKLLLKRLMKYGENCEVIAPKSYREEIKEVIKKTSSLY